MAYTLALPGAGAGDPRGKTAMKIIVAVKQVPVRDSAIRIDAAGKWIEEEDLSFEINEPDAYALEAALLLKDQQGGEVVLLCAGPERAGQIFTGLQSEDLGLGQTGVPCGGHLRCDSAPGGDEGIQGGNCD